MVGKGCDCVKREKHKNIDKNVGGKNDGKTGKVAGGKIRKNKYLQLFVSVFKLSACTFGGGFVIIPLMRKKFVDQLHWIEEQEMLDLTAIAQSSPGAIAVNAAILVGYRVGGIGGALLTVIGTILRPSVSPSGRSASRKRRSIISSPAIPVCPTIPIKSSNLWLRMISN